MAHWAGTASGHESGSGVFFSIKMNGYGYNSGRRNSEDVLLKDNGAFTPVVFAAHMDKVS